jgi:hypothetical protein
MNDPQPWIGQPLSERTTDVDQVQFLREAVDGVLLDWSPAAGAKYQSMRWVSDEGHGEQNPRLCSCSAIPRSSVVRPFWTRFTWFVWEFDSPGNGTRSNLVPALDLFSKRFPLRQSSSRCPHPDMRTRGDRCRVAH